MTSNKLTITRPRASKKDWLDIRALLDLHSNVLTPRSDRDLRHHWEDFFVARNEGEQIMGCIIYQPLVGNIGYVRALAVYPEYHGRGIGAQLLAASLHAAETQGHATVWGLVRDPGFLMKSGFRQVTRAQPCRILELLIGLATAGLWGDVRRIVTVPLYLMKWEQGQAPLLCTAAAIPTPSCKARQGAI